MKNILTTLAFLFVTAIMVAQDVTLTVDAPGRAVAGQRFRIIYTVNSTDGNFNPPQFDPSFSVSGPQQSTSRNVQWINGEVTSVSTTTLIYYVVVSTPGTYTIPPAQFATKKVTVSSEAKEITVTGEANATGQDQTQDNGGDQTARSSNNSDEVSLRLHLGTHEVYAGQPITATLKLYTRINLSGINDLKYPDFKGFLREDIETPPLKSLETEVIDGVQYGTGVIQHFVLYPQIAGDIVINPVEMTVMVQQRNAAHDPFFNDAFFDNFFSNVSTVPRQISTKPVTIHVKPLPVPRPSDFYGAVGSFNLASSISTDKVEINDAITLTYTLKGTGNLSLAGEPIINFPQGIEKYDPKVTVKNSGTSSGSKTFEYLLIPRNTGTFDIPPLSYTVFDPKKEKYVTLRTDGYRVTVTGTANETETTAPVYTPGEDVKYLGQDIRFIKTSNRKLDTVSSSLVRTTYYWLWFVIAFFVTVVILLFRRKHIIRNADLEGMRNRKAAKNARKRLAKANSLLSAGKTASVNAEIAGALWGYVGDKLSIPRSELTRERCFSAMKEKKVEEELLTELDQILSATEYSQYAPRSEGESPSGLCKRAAALIAKLENVLD